MRQLRDNTMRHALLVLAFVALLLLVASWR
jgi:hypothetical protein